MPSGPGAEVVQAGLADAADLRQRGQLVDLGERLVQAPVAAGLPRALPGPAVRVAEHDAGRLVGVQGDGGVHARRARPRSRRPSASPPGRSPPGRRWSRRPRRPWRAPPRRCPSCMSRWVCESATGTRRGSGSGGGAFLSAADAHGRRSYEGHAGHRAGAQPAVACWKGCSRSERCQWWRPGRSPAAVLLGAAVGVRGRGLRRPRRRRAGARRWCMLAIASRDRRDLAGPHDPHDVAAAVQAGGAGQRGRARRSPSASR